MQRSTFWPLYFIVAALGAAATWRFAPAAREALPPSVVDAITDAAKRVTGRKPFVEKKEDDGFALPEMLGKDALAQRGRPAEPAADNPPPTPANNEPSSSAPAAEDRRATLLRPGSGGQANREPRTTSRESRIAEQEREAKTMPAPSFADADVDPAELPAFRGVHPADPKTANWGVTARFTEIEGFQHKDLGNVGGGRFFLIERKMRREEGLTLVGNFTPKHLPQAVMLPAENLYCFSGAPEDLTDNQRKCLRRYYELRAEALDLKYKIEHPRYDDSGNVVNRGAKAGDNADYRAKLDEMKRVAGPIRGLAF